jgi:SAM-dependent methyltransferase
MPQTDTGFINVKDLMKKLTVEELCQTAEAYYASRKNIELPLSKPFGLIDETPNLLTSFARVLKSLHLLSGMTVLDFGAGVCWASKWLTQLGLRVIALDVSPTALKFGRELYARQPVIGKKPTPRFLLYDGHKIGLPDASVDRVMCLDTFHHIPNPDEVLAELSRVLKEGGIAGFSEPGPHHSKTNQSQYEMRQFKVLENDVDVREIWFSAKRAGFARMELDVFYTEPFHLSLTEFEDFLNRGSSGDLFLRLTRIFMLDRRVFYLYKQGRPAAPDSRVRTGLRADLKVTLASTKVRQGTPLVAQVTVTNTSKEVWQPKSVGLGGVLLGCHLLDPNGKVLAYEYFTHPLTPGEGRPILPGEKLQFRLRMPSPARGHYILEFDLVSWLVTWFAMNGSPTVKIPVEVV